MGAVRVPAARHTLEILRLLSTIDVPVSASRISQELGLPRSTTYRLLGEMMDLGFVVHLAEERKYGLGVAAYAMASAYTTQQPLVRASHNHLVKAATLVGGSGHLSRLSGQEIVYLDEVRAPGAASLMTEVGVRLVAAGTASGRIMLAHLPDTERRAAVGAGADFDWDSFEEALDGFRGRGFAVENQEVAPGQESMAVAITDHLGRPAAALAVTFPVGTVGEETYQEVVVRLQESAATISAKLYGRRPGR